MADGEVRFPDGAWRQLEALPQELRWAVQRAVFRLLTEPVPTLADAFPQDDPLPGAYELHLPTDGVTIWYVVTPYGGKEVITVEVVRADT